MAVSDECISFGSTDCFSTFVSREGGQTGFSREIFLGEQVLARLGKGQDWRPELWGFKLCPRRSSPVWPPGKADETVSLNLVKL